VEGDERTPGPGPGAAPEQQGDDRAVEGGAGDRQGVGGPHVVQQRADDRQIRPGREPEAKGLGPHQPVALQLGQPGRRVDDPGLEPQQPHPPPGDGRPAIPRHHQPEGQHEGEEPVVVQVGRDVDQLGPGEGAEQHGAGRPGPPPEGERHRRHRHGRHDARHHRGRGLGHPAEAEVGEPVGRAGVELVDPAVAQDPHRAQQPDHPDHDPDRGQRPTRHRDRRRGDESGPRSRGRRRGRSRGAGFGRHGHDPIFAGRAARLAAALVDVVRLP
jgi:hypothetical protein